MPSITIFSIPKGFDDPHIARIQKNAIASWKAVPDSEVLIFGNDPGVAEVAYEFKVTHIPGVSLNEFGTPLLNSAFSLAHERAKASWVMYINADILLPENFTDTFSLLPDDPLLAVGRRTDLDLLAEENALKSEERKRLFERALQDGTLHSENGIDYFLFRKNKYPNMPPFAIGRRAFDNWLLYAAHANKMKLIDITDVVTVIHQNHHYAPANLLASQKKGPETLKNLGFMKHKTWYYTIADADWKLTSRGIRFNLFYWYPYFRRLVHSFIHQ